MSYTNFINKENISNMGNSQNLPLFKKNSTHYENYEEKPLSFVNKTINQNNSNNIYKRQDSEQEQSNERIKMLQKRQEILNRAQNSEREKITFIKSGNCLDSEQYIQQNNEMKQKRIQNKVNQIQRNLNNDFNDQMMNFEKDDEEFSQNVQNVSNLFGNILIGEPVTPQLLAEVENKKVALYYAPDIIQTLRAREAISRPRFFLQNHNIPENLRAKMVDWMIEVTSSYKCHDQTFFLACQIMDLYFQKVQKPQELSDLHLIGVTCMFLASKIEEIYPLKLSVIFDRIAHKRLSIEQIKNKEAEIIMTLNFELSAATPYEFMTICNLQIDMKKSLSEKVNDYYTKVCKYLCKMSLYDYDLLNSQEYNILAAGIIFVAFKIIEQVETSFPLNLKTQLVKEVLQVQDDALFETSTKILNIAKNFDQLYPNLENLKKFNGFCLDSDE